MQNEEHMKNAANAPDWFNPRRRVQAGKLIAYLYWHGLKASLDDHTYESIEAEQGLDRWRTDQAADDLYALGMADMTAVGERVTIRLLSADMDAGSRPAAAKAERPEQKPFTAGRIRRAS